VWPLDTEDLPERWTTERHGDRTLSVRKRTNEWHTNAVRLELEGTRLDLTSPQLDTAELAGLAARLVPIRADKPRFGQPPVE
jgi:hypothetical protein